MLEYHNTYLTSDILLLADIFENFQRMSMSMSMESYRLELLHYYNLPGFSWDAMLKYTGVEI